jgi:hypothetical protein
MMSAKKLVLVMAVLALVVGIAVSDPREASALGALSFHWSCDPPDGVCDFDVTSSNHTRYFWGFGDGSTFGPTTSTSATHDYNFVGGGHFYTVTLVGFVGSSSSPDNIISCTIEAQGSSPGGNPGASGNCSG